MQITIILYCLAGLWLGQVLTVLLKSWPVPALGIHVVVLVFLYVAVKLAAKVYFPTENDRQLALAKLKSFLSLGAARWIIPAGLCAIVGTGMGMYGTKPLSAVGWFHASLATVLLALLWRNNRSVMLPSGLPVMRCDLSPCRQETGKCVSFLWTLWSDASNSFRWEQSFHLDPGCLSEARSDIHEGRPFSHWVQAHFSDSVRQVVIWFREESLRRGFLPIQEVENVVSFIRTIRYLSDSALHGREEYFSFPIETLADQAGDCEDHAFLAATILHFLGHDVALLYLDLGPAGHLALAYHVAETSAAAAITGPFSIPGKDGKDYHYVETVPTSNDEQLGNLSVQFLRSIRAVEIFPAS